MHHASVPSLLIFFATCSCSREKEPALPGSAALSATLSSLSADVRHSFDQVPSPHEIQLWRASQFVQEACLDKPWPIIEAELRRQKLKCILDHEAQYCIIKEYLVAENVFVSKKTIRHDLYLEFMINTRDAKKVPAAKPGVVVKARPGLRLYPNQHHTDFVATGAYPNGSAVRRVLLQDDVRRILKDYPVLQQVDITYDMIFDRWREDGIASGWHVRVYLKGVVGQQDSDGSLFCSVENLADPLKNRDRKVIGPNSGNPVPSLEVRVWGGHGLNPLGSGSSDGRPR